MRIFVSAFLALALFGAPAAARVPYASPAVPASAEAALLQVAEAMQLLENDRGQEAHDMLERVVASPAFIDLDANQQAAVRYLYGALAISYGDPQAGLEALRKVTEWPHADGEMWRTRLLAAGVADDQAEAAETLTHIARRFPEVLAELEDERLFTLIWRTASLDPKGEAQFQLLDALYDAGWSPQSPFHNPSGLWVTLAQHLIVRENLDKAGRVLSRPLAAPDVAMVRTDRTFDPVVQPRLGEFDVLAAGERKLARLREAAAENPRALKGVNAIATALLELGRYGEALELLDDAIARSTQLTGKAAPFDDLDDLNWTYNHRAQALEGLGRHDESVEALRRGARRPEHGQLNVSQAINLAQHLTLLGRPQEALDAVADVTRRDVSGYGWLASQLARVCAYAQLGETGKARAALDDIMANREDSMAIAQEALFCAGDDARAAELLVSRLDDPLQRSEALEYLQDYQPDPFQTEVERGLEARLLAVRARPEVQAAIARVGRIERHPLPSRRF